MSKSNREWCYDQGCEKCIDVYLRYLPGSTLQHILYSSLPILSASLIPTSLSPRFAHPRPISPQWCHLLDNNKNSEYCAPLTSFDWNTTDPSLIGTSSIDTTCTIWDITTQQVKTQLIAHDKEVYDIAFARGKDVFASSGADGR